MNTRFREDLIVGLRRCIYEDGPGEQHLLSFVKIDVWVPLVRLKS